MKGFEIGPSTNPCTKGIWMWSKPIPLSKTTDLIILDTEGLNSTRKASFYLHILSQDAADAGRV